MAAEEAGRAPAPRSFLGGGKWSPEARAPSRKPCHCLCAEAGRAGVEPRLKRLGKGNLFRLLHGRARFPPAAGEGGKEGTWEWGGSWEIIDPLLWLTSQADTFATGWGQSLPALILGPQARRENFQADGEFLILLLLLLGVFIGDWSHRWLYVVGVGAG